MNIAARILIIKHGSKTDVLCLLFVNNLVIKLSTHNIAIKPTLVRIMEVSLLYLTKKLSKVSAFLDITKSNTSQYEKQQSIPIHNKAQIYLNSIFNISYSKMRLLNFRCKDNTYSSKIIVIFTFCFTFVLIIILIALKIINNNTQSTSFEKNSNIIRNMF